MLRLLLFLLLFLPAAHACAQPASEAEDAAAASEETETEAAVRHLLAESDSLHVVHFWAPWCHNSRHELRNGFWNDLIAATPEVAYTFVTVYNDGELSSDVLDEHGVPGRVHRLAQPDRGPSNRRANRRRTFMGLPLTWTPTTWIFRKDGTLAYAINFGEADQEMMTLLLDRLQRDWSR